MSDKHICAKANSHNHAENGRKFSVYITAGRIRLMQGRIRDFAYPARVYARQQLLLRRSEITLSRQITQWADNNYLYSNTPTVWKCRSDIRHTATTYHIRHTTCDILITYDIPHTTSLNTTYTYDIAFGISHITCDIRFFHLWKARRNIFTSRWGISSFEIRVFTIPVHTFNMFLKAAAVGRGGQGDRQLFRIAWIFMK